MTWIFISDFYHIKEGIIVNDIELRKIISEVYDYKIQTGIQNKGKLLESITPLAEWRAKQIDSILNGD